MQTKEQRRKWYRANKEKAYAWTLAYRNGPKRKEILAQKRADYRKNRNKYLELCRHYRIDKTFGLSSRQYDEKKALSEGRCDICGCTDKLALDHDHSTGFVRSFLCMFCNTRLGTLEDKKFVYQAKQYLDDWEAIQLCQKSYA